MITLSICCYNTVKYPSKQHLLVLLAEASVHPFILNSVFLMDIITTHFVMYCKINVDDNLFKTPEMLTYYRDLRSGLAPILLLHIVWSTIYFTYDISNIVVLIQDHSEDLLKVPYFLTFLNNIALVVASAVTLLQLAEQSERCYFQLSLKAFHHRKFLMTSEPGDEPLALSAHQTLQHMFLIQTIEAEQKFTGLGFFVVDRAALTSILGTAVTYCVIVVQGITIYNKILDKEKDQKCCPQI